jgi:hypothetical protein
MILLSMNLATCLAFNTENDAASTHLVKSMATRMNSCPFDALEVIFPMMSMSHTKNGYGDIMLYSSFGVDIGKNTYY